MASKNTIDSTTQKFLDIHDITNDLVILKDGTASVILTVDAMNFGLLAEEEQDSIMYAYAGLLNSLNYPIQIIIRSQTKDVTGYLRLIKEQEDAVTDRTQQKRIMKYREFVSNLIRERNVLDKKFYISIPAKPLELGLVPVSSVIPGTTTTDVSTVDKSMLIEKARSILEPKRDHLIAQFARIGLYSRQLETQEIIQLFYQSYNPEAFEGQSMDDSKSYTAPLVSASIEGSTMNMQDQNQNQTPAPGAQQNQQQDQAQQPAQPNVSETGTPEQPPTLPGATPKTPPEQSAPTTNLPQDQIQGKEQVQTQQPGGYTPTQMPTNQQTNTAAQTQQVPVANGEQNATQQPALENNPVQQEQPQQGPQTNQAPGTANTAEPGTSSETPLPPAPELPKTQPGETDPSVPQETEIKIQKPTETPQKPAAESNPTQGTQSQQGAQPQQQTGQPQQQQAQQPANQNQEMAPLPEIK